MKKVLFAVFCFIALTSSAQLKTPAPSSTQTIKQDFGLSSIELTYSRPNIRGRKIFGDLVPYGKLWRTGANAPTRIKFGDDVTVGGQAVKAGEYALYTIPNADEWEIILSKGFEGVSEYKKEEDVARFKVPAENSTNLNVETFTMEFHNLKPESCDLTLIWGNTIVVIPITTNIKDKMRASLDAAMKGNDKPYWQAANFYYEYDKDYAKALDNVNHALETNKDAYYMYMLKARIQKAAGDNTGAKASATKTVELATAQKNDDYIKQGNDFLKAL